MQSFQWMRRFITFFALVIMVVGSFGQSAQAMRVGPSTTMDFEQAFRKVSDPDTSRATLYFNQTTLEDGRVWGDKSVNKDQANIYDLSGNVIDSRTAAADEFLVTLSALSQSFEVDTVVAPTDVVFILDVSGSMVTNRIPGSTDTRLAVMVDALNEVITILMKANPENRAAVLAFGGHPVSGMNGSRIEPILKLQNLADSVEATWNETTEVGEIFTISSRTNTTAGQVYINVADEVPNTALSGNRSVRAEGGTPTARGIYRGADILLENDDTLFEAELANGDTVELIRKPNIILLTDGDPTFGFSDFTFQGTNNNSGYAFDSDLGHDMGSGSGSDLGIDTTTVLTAAYMKQQVTNHYFRDNGNQTNAAGFYTIGLGIGNSQHALAVLDPGTNAQNITQSYNNKTYNMRTVLSDFVNSSNTDISFPALNRNSSSARRLVTVQNPNRFVTDFAYADGFFPASDADELTDAFRSIAQKIVSQGGYATAATGSRPELDGHLVFSDVLGEYMEFRSFEGFWFDNQAWTGDNWNQIMTDADKTARNDFISRMYGHYTGLTPEEFGEMIDNSLAAGHKNAFVYYTNEERIFLGSFYGSGGVQNPVPQDATAYVRVYVVSGTVENPVTGDKTTLDEVAFHVLTALEAGDFRETYAEPVGTPVLANQIVRSLQAGQQIVRWYIPPSLIPLRTVAPRKDANGDFDGGIVIKEVPPIHFMYSVGLREDLDLSEISEDYREENTTRNPFSTRSEALNFFTNDWQNTGNESKYFFPPNQHNPYYFFTEEMANEDGVIPVFVKTESTSQASARRDGIARAAEVPTGYERATGPIGTGPYCVIIEGVIDLTQPTELRQEMVEVDPALLQVDNNTNELYVEIGTVRRPFEFQVLEKTSNPTGTADNTKERVDFGIGGDNWGFMTDENGNRLVDEEGNPIWVAMVAHKLGNNGRLTIPETSVTVRKEWLDDEVKAQDVWVQLYGNGEPVGEPVQMIDPDNDSVFEYTWQYLPMFELEVDDNEDTTFIEYALQEGTWDGATFTPFDPDTPIAIDGTNPTEYMRVIIRQPEWNDVDGYWSTGVITNLLDRPDEMVVLIDKVINGVDVSEFTPTDGAFSGDPRVTDEKGIAFEWRTGGTLGATNLDDTGTPLTEPAGGTFNDWFSGGTAKFVFDSTQQGSFPLTLIEYSNVPGYNLTVNIDEVLGGDLVSDVRNITPQSPDMRGVDIQWQAGGVVQLVWTNSYVSEDAATLRLEKVFNGADLPEGEPANLSFLVQGWATPDMSGDPFYERTIYFTQFDENNGFTLENLDPGFYRVTESGCEVSGFRVIIEEDNPQDFELEPNTDHTVTFTNTYYTLARLTVRKIVEGLPEGQDPIGLVFTTHGTNFISPTLEAEYVTLQPYAMIEDRDDFGNRQFTLENLVPGDYTVYETGGRVPGFAMRTTPEPNEDGEVVLGLTLASGEHGLLEFTNEYFLGSITLRKEFTGDEIPNIPTDLAFVITGMAESYDPTEGETQVEVTFDPIYYRDFVEGVYVIEDVKLGTYTVTEINNDIEGFDLNVTILPEGSIAVTDTTPDVEVFITNEYTTHSITLRKVFEGDTLPHPPTDLVFTIVGVDSEGNEIYHETVNYSEFVNGELVISGLYAGTYTVTESGGEMVGFELTVISDNPIEVVLSDENRNGNATFINRYMSEETNPSLGQITLRKVFEGDDIPEDLFPDISFHIIGTNDAGETIYTNTIRYAEFTNGQFVLSNLPAGTYHITESGADIDDPDWTWEIISKDPAVTVDNPTLEVTLPVGGRGDATFVNRYTGPPGEVGSERLTIRKVFEGDELPNIPTDLTFEVVGVNDDGAEIFRQTYNYTDFVNGALIIEPVEIGTYTITETGGEMYGFTMEIISDNPIIAQVEEGRRGDATFINRYTKLPLGSLAIQKVFEGDILPQPPTDLVFTITGPNDFSQQVNYSDFVDGLFTLENLIIGTYTVTEVGGEVDGFTLEIISDNPIDVEVPANGTGHATFVNRYTADTVKPPPEPARGQLTIQKVFEGDTLPTPPTNLQFEVVGVNEEGVNIVRRVVHYRDFRDGKYVLTELLPGKYTITEIGGQVDGFQMTVVSDNPITVQLGEGKEAIAKFINRYEKLAISEPEAPQTPSPQPDGVLIQTGDVTSNIIWIGLLLLAIGGFVYTLYVRRKKQP